MITKIREKYNSIFLYLDERSLRIWSATEARALGHGGVSLVHAATGISRPTIYRGLRDLESPVEHSLGRCRQRGGGQKNVRKKIRGYSRHLTTLLIRLRLVIPSLLYVGQPRVCVILPKN